MSKKENKKLTPEEIEAKKKEREEYEKLRKAHDEEEAKKIAAFKQKYVPGDLESTFVNFYMENPFFGVISLNVSRREDWKCPTAYVGARPTENSGPEIIMGYNPHFLSQLSKEQKRAVITHEYYHLIFEHILGRSIGDRGLATLWNWATDLAINSLIEETPLSDKNGKPNKLPDMCLLPGRVCKDPLTGKPIEGPYAEFIQNAPFGESSDYYFDALRKIKEEQGDGEEEINIVAGKMGTMDDHDGWGALPEDVKSEIREKVKGILGDAVSKADREDSWGNISSTTQELLRKLSSREVDWKSIVKQFFGRARSTERTSTIKRINKKVPYIHPGVKRNTIATFACFIDQSGSMSDEDIAMLFGELKSLSEQTEIDVFHFDTEIDENSHMVWKKSTPFPKALRTRCGGTDFNSVADFCNKKGNRGKWSGVVILTDGYAPVMKQIMGSKVLWVITPHGTMETVRTGDLAVKMKAGDRSFKKY